FAVSSSRPSAAPSSRSSVSCSFVRLPQLTTLESGGRKRDVRRLRPLVALLGLELHLRVLSERLVALADDRAVMNEQILAAAVGGDEPVSLVGVEPLHGSGCHRCSISSASFRHG